MWEALRRAELEDEVRELFGEARSWYRKKGGALVLQVRLASEVGLPVHLQCYWLQQAMIVMNVMNVINTHLVSCGNTPHMSEV